MMAVFASAGSAAPRASDFEQAVPSVHAARAAAQRVVTLKPGRPFELAGFVWRGSGRPSISVQSHGRRGWSRWVRVGASGIDGPDRAPSPFGGEHVRGSSEPVWTGASDALRVRVAGGGVKDLRAHFVRVHAGRSARAAGTGGAPPGGAAAPAIVTRDQWGASACKPRATPQYGEVLAAVVHHTESTNSYSQSEAPSVVLGICRYHRNGRGWNDIGYNLLIDRFGTVYEGRAGGVDKAVVGAHAQGYNGQTTGIALIGGFMSVSPSQAAMDSLQRVIQWKLGLAGVTRNERAALISTGGVYNRFKYGRTVWARPVSGHRDLDSTDCPGNVLYAKLPGLASFLTGAPRPATKLSMRLKRVATPGGGQAVAVSGRLRSAGQPVSGRTVQVQAFTSTGWLTLTEARTDGNGFWQTTVAPARRYFLRGSFAGDDGLRSVRSLWRYSPKLRRITN